MITMILDISNFNQEVIESAIPVMVDFWAPWCGPCQAVAPLVEKIADENKGKLKVAKVNIDYNPALPSRYNIMSIPTLIMFKNGQEIGRVVGYNPAKIDEMVKKGVE